MSDNAALPMTIEPIKVTQFAHLKVAFEYVGAMEVLEALEKLKKEFPNATGLGLAIATAQVVASEFKTTMLTKNLSTAMKSGFDPEGGVLLMELRKDGMYLVMNSEPEAKP